MNMTEFYHRVYSIMKYMSITFAITESRFQRSVELSLVEFFGLGFFVAPREKYYGLLNQTDESKFFLSQMQMLYQYAVF